MTPVISVIVPNYNHKEFLKQRLESILNQTFQNFEIIILDDASTDGSVELLKNYADNSKVSNFSINKANSGSPFRQWKKGIELAKGEYIWIAESDDLCEVTFLEKIMDYLICTDRGIDLLYSQSIDIDEKGKIIASRIKWTSEFHDNIWTENFCLSGKAFLEKYLKVKNIIPNASAVVFKKKLIDYTIFTEDILNMEMCGDWYLWCKLSVSSNNIAFLAEELNYFRNHKGVTRNHHNLDKKKRRLLEESKIRKYLTSLVVSQDQEVKRMYQKWFSLFSVKDIFRKAFWSIFIPKYWVYFFSSYKKLKVNARE